MVMETLAASTTAVAVPEDPAMVVQREVETEGCRDMLRSGMQMLAVLELSCPHLVHVGDPDLVEVLEAAINSLPRLQEVRLRGALEEAAEELALLAVKGAQGVRVCTSRMCYQASFSVPKAPAESREARRRARAARRGGGQAEPRVVCRSWELCDCGAL